MLTTLLLGWLLLVAYYNTYVGNSHGAQQVVNVRRCSRVPIEDMEKPKAKVMELKDTSEIQQQLAALERLATQPRILKEDEAQTEPYWASEL